MAYMPRSRNVRSNCDTRLHCPFFFKLLPFVTLFLFPTFLVRLVLSAGVAEHQRLRQIVQLTNLYFGTVLQHPRLGMYTHLKNVLRSPTTVRNPRPLNANMCRRPRRMWKRIYVKDHISASSGIFWDLSATPHTKILRYTVSKKIREPNRLHMLIHC